MKFLHAADIHLDSPMTGLLGHGEIPDDVTRHCTRRAFANLVDLAIEQDVAFIVIAGDLYDGDWRDYSTGLFFASEMRRLGRPCYLIRGNHDAKSVITRSLQPPPNVREFSARKPETMLLEGLEVVLHGQSFPNRAVPDDLTPHYPAAVPGKLNIGLLHTSCDDPGDHETYAPCRREALVAKGYQYWALGHIHQRGELHDPGSSPWIVFSGNIQGRHVRETGPKGCTIVEFEGDRILAAEHHDLDVLRWAWLRIPVDGADTLAEITARLSFELRAALDQAGGRPLIARMTLTGLTQCHGDLIAHPAQLEAECRNAAAAISDRLFIERVRTETRLPPAPLLEENAAADLERAFLAAVEDPAVQQLLLRDFGNLMQQLPASNDPDRYRPPSGPGALQDLAADAWQIVARTLSGRTA